VGKPVLTIYLNWLIGVFMSSSISNTFPQAPLVVPKPLARPAAPTIDSDGDNDGSKGAKAPVTPAQTAQPVLPNGAPGGIVSLKA
jgi:hypothetical protein